MINWEFANDFHPASKVWIYQCNRELTAAEASEIDSALLLFSKEWTSHKQELKASGVVLLNRFIVLLADESLNSVGGCSIDSSVKFIRSIENHFGISLLDRTVLLFEIAGKMHEVSINELEKYISNGTITFDSVYFNNTVTSLFEMKKNWQIPVKNSWMRSKFKALID